MLLLCAAGCGALQHSGMWSLNRAADGRGWATLTFDVSNTSAIAANYEAAGMRALYPLSWTAPQKQQCFAPVPHTRTTPSGYFGCITIAPDWKARWQAALREIRPLIASGAVVGVFLGDEHLYFGVTLAEVKLVADQIRGDFPAAIIYMNEAPDVAMCGYSKANVTLFADGECLPQNVDWFGFDFYHQDPSSWLDAREAYRHHVYPRFSRPDQRVVPVSLGYQEGNLTAAEAASLDAFCAENAIEFLKFGLEDPRVVGLFPFYWAGGTRHPDGSITGGAGISLLPRCAAAYKAIGELIIAAGPSGTTSDPAHNPPTGSGPFPEPKCATPIAPPPAEWSWCKRT